MTDLVRAKKGDQETTFSRIAWDLLGKNKEGWKLIKETPKDVKEKLTASKGGGADKDKDKDKGKGGGTDGNPGGEQTPKEIAKEKIRLAIDLEERGELNEAVSLLNEAKKIFPGNNPYLNTVLNRVTEKLNPDGKDKGTEGSQGSNPGDQE